MKRTEYQSIGDVLRLTLQDNRMQSRLDEVRAVEAWAGVVGEYVASQCRRPVVRGGVMTVGTPNAALRNELGMNRTGLMRALNRAVGSDVITMMRFTS